jgi:hypothetical protein
VISCLRLILQILDAILTNALAAPAPTPPASTHPSSTAPSSDAWPSGSRISSTVAGSSSSNGPRVTPMKAGSRVTARYMPDLGTGQVCRVETDRYLVTFPDAPEGAYADLFHLGELVLVEPAKAAA